ncbi:L-type lectin-domain containing receptor kinase S.6 [Linum grandiflorum]
MTATSISETTPKSTASFFSRFIFSIIQSPLCPPADGLASLITSSLSDGFMGLPDPALNPKDSFVAVEFDTNYDSSLQDPTHGDHVGVDVNTIVSSV